VPNDVVATSACSSKGLKRSMGETVSTVLFRTQTDQ
jgi:hypothetical protein